MMFFKSILPVCLIFFAALPLRATRYYVNQSASGTNNGSSWQDAFTDLQSALQVAVAGDTVWVAAGTYLPTSTTDRTISFRPRSGVALFGGFSGNENSLDQRDWETNATILSGNIGTPDTADNSFHVLYFTDVAENTTLDGLTITEGNASNVAKHHSGGGILVDDSSATQTVRLNVRNCRLLYNQAIYRGGALSISGNGWDYSHFSNCLFLQNRAQSGGAVDIGSKTFKAGAFEYCRFVKNETVLDGGALIIGWGLPRLAHCSFEENVARLGSSIFLSGGKSANQAYLEDCTFIKNRSNATTSNSSNFYAELGEGMDTFTMSRCLFENNISGNSTSGIALEIEVINPNGTHILLTDCVLKENTSLVFFGSSIKIDVKFPQAAHTIQFSKCLFNEKSSRAIFISKNSSIGPTTQITIDSCMFDSCIIALSVSTHQRSRLEVTNSIFRSNQGNFAVLDLLAENNQIANCIFTKNKAEYLFQFFGNNQLTGNYQIENCIIQNNNLQFFCIAEFSDIVLANCLIKSNQIAQDLGFQLPVISAFVYNTIFQNNTGWLLCLPSNTKPHYAHCAFDSIPANAPATTTFGPGNLVGEDPAFVSPGTGNFRLQPCSPLANAGDNAHAPLMHDLDGMARISGGNVDIGPYESFGPALNEPPVVSPPCPDISDGAIDLAPIGGCAPYFIAWTHSDGTTGEQLTGLPAGDYAITVTDSGKGIIELVASVPEPLSATGVALPLECGGTTGGSAAVAVHAGTPPFAFTWADGSTDSLRTDLPIGTYLITVSDANGCIVVSQSKVERSSGSLGVSIEVGEITCQGSQDGTLTVLPTNGKSPYTWQWASGETSPTLSPIGPGTYHGMLTDALGCSIVWALPLSEPDSLQTTITTTNTSDSMAATGIIHVQPFGGTAPYSIAWGTGASGFVLTDLLAGTYLFTITDARGCIQTGSAEVGITVGTETQSPTSWIRAFPNPATHAVVLEGMLPLAGTVRCLLFDALGKVVQVSEFAGTDRIVQVVIPVGHISDGIYTWQLQSGQWVRAGRFVIAH